MKEEKEEKKEEDQTEESRKRRVVQIDFSVWKPRTNVGAGFCWDLHEMRGFASPWCCICQDQCHQPDGFVFLHIQAKSSSQMDKWTENNEYF